MTSMTESSTDPCSFTTDFGDGTYRFRLKMDGATELEEKCDAGIGAIYMRLHGPAYTMLDVRETIRLGLIGGGTAPVKALSLVKRYVDERPIDESWLLARTIVGALMHGVANDPPPLAVPRPAAKTELDETNDDERSVNPTLSAVMQSRFGKQQK
jgi:hypothetical protein